MSIKGTKTEQNLKDILTVNHGQIVDIYIFELADVEGENDVAQVFRPQQRVKRDMHMVI